MSADKVANKMSKLSVSDAEIVPASKILKQLDTNSLRIMYKADHKNADVEKMKSGPLRAHVMDAINTAAAKYFINALDTKQLTEMLAPLNIDHAHNNANYRPVLVKRSQEQLTEKSITDFLNAYATSAFLRSALESVEVAAPESAKKADLIATLSSHLEYEGLKTYLTSLTESVLRDLAYDLNLDKDPTSTPSKNALIQAITTLEEVQKPKKKKVVKPKISSKKPKIKAGVSYVDLFNYYNVTELVQFCKDNKIKTSGNKKEVINRILAWLDGDKENTAAGVVVRKKKSKKAAGKKAASPRTQKKEVVAEKADEVEEDVEEDVEDEGEEDEADADAEIVDVEEDEQDKAPEQDEEPAEESDEEDEPEPEPEPVKKVVPKKIEAKKTSPAPVQKKVVEEADGIEPEDEDHEMDLDNLEKYSTKYLKAYCDEEGIKVKTFTKKAMIPAILAYNENSEDEA